ncbi:50S ribosomal protein L3 [Candidatus Woesearchaeota archaeon]|nr:50S ribosomal protein L3 [Candidatus Woesearchaeota archaeon]
MGKRHSPRRGSMQYWPRARSKRPFTSVSARASASEAKPLEFAGYKAGMTHIVVKDNGKNSMTKGQNITVPVTVIECPQLKVAGVRFYGPEGYGIKVVTEVLNSKFDKELSRTLDLPKKQIDFEKQISTIPEGADDLRVLVYTEPKKAGIGKKRPEVFEMALGGKIEDKIEYVKAHAAQGIVVSDAFKAGEYIDAHAVSIGKGFQGAVKRFGVDIRQRKSEKTKRGTGSLGPWTSQGHIMYRVPSAGKMGYHSRVDYNKKIMLISDKPEDVNVKGGFIRYGEVKSTFVLVKGSVPGPKKRLVRLVGAIRLSPKIEKIAPQVTKIVKESPQGC